MDDAALVILAVALAGAVVVFVYLRRLKRAAVQMLETARRVEANMESFRATTGTNRLPETTKPGTDRPSDV